MRDTGAEMNDSWRIVLTGILLVSRCNLLVRNNIFVQERKADRYRVSWGGYVGTTRRNVMRLRPMWGHGRSKSQVQRRAGWDSG